MKRIKYQFQGFVEDDKRKGRTSQSTMKKQKLALKSLGIMAKNIGNTTESDQEIEVVAQKTNNHKIMTDLQPGIDLGMITHGCCMNNTAKTVDSSINDDSKSKVICSGDDDQSCNAGQRSETDIFGPYKWLDSEIKRLSIVLQSEVFLQEKLLFLSTFLGLEK